MGRGVGGGEDRDTARGRGGGRGGRRYCPGGGGRREGAAAAAAAASPAATQTPGAAEAVSRSAFPPILWIQGTSESQPGRVCGGRRRRERLLERGPARSGPGGRRGGREERRGPGDPVPAAIPGAAHPVSSLVLPSVPRREKKKPETPRMGGRKGESNFAHRRAEARGWQDGGALGRKGAFVRLVARGPLEQPFGAGAGVEGTRRFQGLQSRPPKGCRRRVWGVGGGGQGRVLWEPPKAVVEPRGGSSMHLGLRT